METGRGWVTGCGDGGQCNQAAAMAGNAISMQWPSSVLQDSVLSFGSVLLPCVAVAGALLPSQLTRQVLCTCRTKYSKFVSSYSSVRDKSRLYRPCIIMCDKDAENTKNATKGNSQCRECRKLWTFHQLGFRVK